MLAEKIREGAALKPQSYGHFYAEKDSYNEHTLLLEAVGETCAMGSALDGCAVAERQMPMEKYIELLSNAANIHTGDYDRSDFPDVSDQLMEDARTAHLYGTDMETLAALQVDDDEAVNVAMHVLCEETWSEAMVYAPNAMLVHFAYNRLLRVEVYDDFGDVVGSKLVDKSDEGARCTVRDLVIYMNDTLHMTREAIADALEWWGVG